MPAILNTPYRSIVVPIPYLANSGLDYVPPNSPPSQPITETRYAVILNIAGLFPGDTNSALITGFTITFNSNLKIYNFPAAPSMMFGNAPYPGLLAVQITLFPGQLVNNPGPADILSLLDLYIGLNGFHAGFIPIVLGLGKVSQNGLSIDAITIRGLWHKLTYSDADFSGLVPAVNAKAEFLVYPTPNND